MVLDEEKKNVDEKKSDEKVTMEIIKDIADTVDPMIKLTIYTQSK